MDERPFNFPLPPLHTRRRLIAGVVVLLVIVVAWTSWHRPAHALPLARDGAAWNAEVRCVLSGAPATCPASTAHGPVLVGVGPVQIKVFGGAQGRAAVLFWRDAGPVRFDGLEYARGYPPLEDSCVFHLGGDWWQIGPFSDPTRMGCVRGFTLTGGG